ncbi:hypothetical protein GCM10010525_30570 [Glutamicibacter bergerei]
MVTGSKTLVHVKEGPFYRTAQIYWQERHRKSMPSRQTGDQLVTEDSTGPNIMGQSRL